MEIVSKIPLEELREWAHHPTTLKVVEFLEECRQGLEEELTSGATCYLNSQEQTALSTIALTSRIEGLNLIPRVLQEIKEADDD